MIRWGACPRCTPSGSGRADAKGQGWDCGAGAQTTASGSTWCRARLAAGPEECVFMSSRAASDGARTVQRPAGHSSGESDESALLTGSGLRHKNSGTKPLPPPGRAALCLRRIKFHRAGLPGRRRCSRPAARALRGGAALADGSPFHSGTPCFSIPPCRMLQL